MNTQMVYRVLADVVVVIHFTYVGCVILGFLAILLGALFRWRWVRNFWLRLVHFAMIAVVAVQALAGVLCPLTTLENFLRTKGGGQAHYGTFVGYWAHELLFYDAPPWVFTIAYCAFAAAVLGTLLLVPPELPNSITRRLTCWKRTGCNPSNQ